MSTAGLLIMIVSVGIVTVLFAWCIYKVLSSPAGESQKLHATDMHTPDQDAE